MPGPSPSERSKAEGPRPRRSGLVLCGGRSRRMGSDKAVLDLAGTRLIDLAVAALTPLTEAVVLATGEAPRYLELGLDTVLDSHAGCGPLGGLVAGLEHAKLHDRDPVLVLACDTPRASARLFELLVERLESSSADACLLRTAEGIEPLYAVYKTSCAAPARAALAAGQRRMNAFHEAVELAFLDETELPHELAERRPATNLNTPSEYEAERAYFDRHEALEQ
ncbi:MAG: molybdenum cofactor guanylyltransferase [Planctomycetota bacterium]|nr:molybdenum cofactor guanylyltransferase [Planctomycetota bacterium]